MSSNLNGVGSPLAIGEKQEDKGHNSFFSKVAGTKTEICSFSISTINSDYDDKFYVI